MRLKLLHLEDNEYDAELIAEVLKNADFDCEVTWVKEQKEYRAALDGAGWDVILADYALPGFNGIVALKLALETNLDVPFIFVSGVLGEDVAVEALKQGACDYVLKSQLSRLPMVLQRALREAHLLLAQKHGATSLQTSLVSQEGERQFRILADSIPTLSCMADAAGYFFWYNQRWYEYTGTTPEAMEGWGWQAVHDPRELPRVMACWQDSIRTGESFEMEFPLRRRDGVFRSHLCRAVPFKDGEGVITRWFGNLTDVDVIRQTGEVLRARELETRQLNDDLERRIKEHTGQLRESEARYRMLIDNIQDYSIIMLDVQGNVVSWNSSAQRLKQYTAEEIIGRHFSCFYPQEELLAGLPEFRLREVAVKGHIEHDGWRVRKDGTVFWGTVMITALRDEAGDLRGFSKMTRDTSERKLVEEKLKAQTNRLRQQAAIVDLAPAAIMVRAAATGKILSWSKGAEETYGYTRQQALGFTSTELLKTVFPVPYQEIEMELKDTGRWAGELEQTTADGSTIILSSRASWHHAQADEGDLILIINSDITEKKRAERKIIEMSSRLNLALQAGQVGVWTIDLADNSVRSDERLPPLFALPPETRRCGIEAYFERIHQDDLPQVQLDISRASESGSFAIEFRVLWPDGSLHYLAAKGQVTYEDRKAVGITGICWDITDRRNTEELLRTFTNRLMMATKAGSVGIWDLDIANNKLVWDDQMFRLYGTRREQFSGAYEAWQAGLHPDDRQRAHDEFQQAMRGEKHFDTEFRVVWPDGTVHYIRALAKLQRDAHGGSCNMIGTNWDVTDRRTMEKALIQRGAELESANAELRVFARKLESSNRELQDFASVAAHDLQEPLRKVRAFGGRLGSIVLDSNLDDKAKDYLDRMLKAVSRMQSLIDDLLSFSRITTQGRPFEKVDLARIAAEVMTDLEERVSQTGAVIEMDGLATLNADPMQMRQLLQNLIGNSLKFQKPGTQPRVRIHGEFGRAAGASEVLYRLTVADNGIGFDEKFLDRIFTVFQRLHSRTEYEGTGVGLAICRKIAQRHGGTITARSTINGGASFTVEFPLDGLAQLSEALNNTLGSQPALAGKESH